MTVVRTGSRNGSAGPIPAASRSADRTSTTRGRREKRMDASGVEYKASNASEKRERGGDKRGGVNAVQLEGKLDSLEQRMRDASPTKLRYTNRPIPSDAPGGIDRLTLLHSLLFSNELFNIFFSFSDPKFFSCTKYLNPFLLICH